MNNHFFLLNMLRGYNKPGTDKESIEILRDAINAEYANLQYDRKKNFTTHITNLKSNNDIISLWDIYTSISENTNITSSAKNNENESLRSEVGKLKILKTIGYSLVPTITEPNTSNINNYISKKFLDKIRILYDNIEEEKNKSMEYYKTPDSSKL